MLLDDDMTEKSVTWKPIPDYGDLFPLDEFLKNCELGYFIDYDGHGYLAIEDQMSDVFIKPSTIREHLDGILFTHVVWFNK